MYTFTNPPVIETILGVQFQPLRSFSNAHLGAFWKELDEQWADVSDAPPLPPQFEEFGEARSWAQVGLQLRVTQEVASRLQIRNATKDRMIQIQNSRLHYNWMGQGSNYPRYAKVRPEFDTVLTKLEQFLAKKSLGDLRRNQWEVTYINHIPKGAIWKNPQDLPQVFRFLAAFDSPTPVRLESLDGEWHYEIVPKRGRLHVQLLHGRRPDPPTSEVLRLTLTARGPVQPGLTLDEGLNLGHEAIVKTFMELTTDIAHEYWGLTNATD